MPTAKASPASEMTLIVRPARLSTIIVAIRQMGMADAMRRVAAVRRRNSHRAPTARMIPSIRLLVRSEIARLMKTDGSKLL